MWWRLTSGGFAVTRDVRRDAELANRIQDPFLRRSVKTALHLRRYFPFYVFGTLMVVVVSIFPTIQNRGGSDAAGRTRVSSGSQTNDTVAPVAQATASGGPSSGGAVAGGRPA